ncbi:MAG: efflux RND transporter periplasmic adaptor subunit [Candidatus Latescibacterota bacterium]
MKKIMIIALLSLIVGFGAGYIVFRSSQKDITKLSQISPEYKSGQKKVLFYKDPMHPWYTSDKPGKAPDCGMDLVPVYEGEEGTARGVKIDPTVVQNIGVKIEEVTKRNLSRTVRAPGKISPDETRYSVVNSKVSGWVEKLYVDYTGMMVDKGQPLLEIYSPELVATQQEYLQALSYRKKLEGNGQTDALLGADQLIESAGSRLRYLDITDSEIQSLKERGTPVKAMTLFSPLTGIVLEKSVVNGQNIMSGAELFKIADLSVVWLWADVYQNEMSFVKAGQTARISVSNLPGKVFSGKISFISPTMNGDTRTVPVRIELPNTPGLELRPEMFAAVQFEAPVLQNVVAVPEQAIIRSGERNIAVMALGGGYFEPREVKLGFSSDGYTQVLEGIHAGEKIVVSSQFLIDAESNLKAAVGQMIMPGMNMPIPATVPGQKTVSETKGQSMPGMDMPATEKKTAPPEKKAQEMRGMNMDTGKKTDTVKPAPSGKNGEKKKTIYTCEMHPEIQSDKPGNCPKCGMKLIPKK